MRFKIYRKFVLTSVLCGLFWMPLSIYASGAGDVVDDVVDGVTDVVDTIGDVISGAGEWLDLVNEAMGASGYKDSGSATYVKPTTTAPDQGAISVLSYNIKGFPEAIDGITEAQMRQISSMVESWAVDIATFQEDWVTHEELISNLSMTNYPYRMKHYSGTPFSFGDGLFIASRHPLNDNTASRIQWDKCKGTLNEFIAGNISSPDCATEKGFSMARVSIAGDLEIDVYTNHANTGSDLDVNGTNMRQMAAYINSHSAGRPVIVTGDFNMSFSWGGDMKAVLDEFVASTGVRFICQDLNSCSSIDMIAYRGNDQWTMSGLSMGNISGDNPSDHAPKLGVISYSRNPDFEEPASFNVSLRSNAFNKYLVCENNGGNTVNANRSSIGSWEKFTLNGPSSFLGCIESGDPVTIQSSGGYFWSAQTNGNLDCDRRDALSYETFSIVNHTRPSGCLTAGDTISLKSVHNKYVVGESDGSADADRSSIGSWEKFTITFN